MTPVTITFSSTTSAEERESAVKTIQSWHDEIAEAGFLHSKSQHPLLSRQAFATIKGPKVEGVLRRLLAMVAVEDASVAPARKLILGKAPD